MRFGGSSELIVQMLPMSWNAKALSGFIGHRRRDIVSLPVRFWTLPKYPEYVVVYRPERKPLQVIAVLHWKRDIGKLLRNR